MLYPSSEDYKDYFVSYGISESRPHQSWTDVRTQKHKIEGNIYCFPHDPIWLNNMHFMFYIPQGSKNILPRICLKTHQILDLGTGSGRWVFEVGAANPSARVIGLDLVPVQPLEEPVKNCEFYVADFNDGLVKLFSSCSMDFVHCRFSPQYILNRTNERTET